jgi:hypothetical protein
LTSSNPYRRKRVTIDIEIVINIIEAVITHNLVLCITFKRKLHLTLNNFTLSGTPGGSTTPEECAPCPGDSTTSGACGDVTGINRNLLIYRRTISASYG